MAKIARDKMGMVLELDDGTFEISPQLMGQLETHKTNKGIEYILDTLPGISPSLQPGMSVFYHRIGKNSNVPQRFINFKGIYRVITRNSYTAENIVEPVKDLAEVTRVINSARREFLKAIKGQKKEYRTFV